MVWGLWDLGVDKGFRVYLDPKEPTFLGLFCDDFLV